MATNVKKITKTIGGTEYGLQVESAIRDGVGNVIVDTYEVKGHKHVKADLTDFAHTHVISDVTGLQNALDDKQDKLTAQTAYTTVGDKDTIPVITTNALGQVTSITTVSVDHPAGATSSANVIDSVTDGVVKIHKSIAQTDGAIGTETTHTSDVEVYTKGQADTLLAGKSGTDHKHVIADITDFTETQLSKEQSGTGNVVTDIAVSGHKITYTMGNVDLSSKQDKFDDGSATVATVADNIISIQPEVAQTNGAITTGNAAVIQTYDKDHIDELVKGPASATDGNIAVFDGTTGKLIKDGGKSITAIVEIAEGKTASYVIAKKSDITGTEETSGDYTNVTTITGVDITKLKIGDIILVTELTSPDFWVSAVNKTGETITSVSLSRMETAKVDISGKADKLAGAGNAEISSLNAETGVVTIHHGIDQATTLAISTESAHANDSTVYSKAKSDELFETKFNYSPDLSWTY